MSYEGSKYKTKFYKAQNMPFHGDAKQQRNDKNKQNLPKKIESPSYKGLQNTISVQIPKKSIDINRAINATNENCLVQNHWEWTTPQIVSPNPNPSVQP